MDLQMHQGRERVGRIRSLAQTDMCKNRWQEAAVSKGGSARRWVMAWGVGWGREAPRGGATSVYRNMYLLTLMLGKTEGKRRRGQQ